MIYLLTLFLTILASALITRLYRKYHNPSASISLANDFNFKDYVGKWYIIAQLPNLLEYNLENLTMEHELTDKNYIKLRIKGNKKGHKNRKINQKGKIWPRYQDSRPSLNVQFLWPLTYNCRIIYISKNYEEVMFTTITKDRLWIMSKKSIMDDKTYQNLLNICQKKTFDLSDLEKIHHDKN